MNRIFENIAEWLKSKRTQIKSAKERKQNKIEELENESAINSVVFNDKLYVHITGDSILDVKEFGLDPAKVVSSMRKSRLEWAKHKQVV